MFRKTFNLNVQLTIQLSMMNIQLLKLNVHLTLKVDSTIKIECLLTIQHTKLNISTQKVEHSTFKLCSDFTDALKLDPNAWWL